jgi:Ran-binding protein 3
VFVCAADGKLFEFVDGQWKERGRGDMRLNVHQSTKKARLVMRQKGSQRLLLNANLYPKMSTSKMVGGKGATFAAVNAAPPVPGEGQKEGEAAESAAATAAAAAAAVMRTFAFKAKGADEITAFLAAVDRYKGGREAHPDAF